MLKYLVRRIVQMVPILLAVALLIFVLFSVIPGTFASSVGADGKGMLDDKVIARMNESFGLNDPVYVRFGRYVLDLVQFDLGDSFRTRRPVLDELASRAVPTLKLICGSMLFAIIVGLPLGFVAALKPGTLLDSLSMVTAVSGLSIPKFWLGLLMMYLFALTLGWLPSFGYGTGGLRHLIMPSIALGVAPMALLARTTRAAVLDVLNADFVRTARSKGMSELKVVRWHLVRNSLVIVLTTIGLQFGTVIGEAVVIEQLFAWPGIGSLMVDSVALRDIPVVQGCILVIVLFFLVVNMLIDILCAIIDPRIRYD